MTSDLLTRLESWRECARTGKPAWLAEGAPRIVALLEAELAAQGIEAGTATTAGRGPQDESPVGEADAPKGGQ